MDHSTHLTQLLARRAQELDVLGQLRNAVHLHMVAAQLFGRAPLRLTFDHLAQLCDALGGNGLGDLLLRGRRFVAVGREQAGQQPPLQVVQVHRLQRLVRRVRRTTAGVVAAVGLDDLRDHRRQPLVHVGQLVVVSQHVEEHLPHRIDVFGRQAVGVRLVVVQHGPGAQRGGKVQIEHRVVGVAVVRPAKYGACKTLAQGFAVAEPEHAHHPACVDRLRRAHRDTLSAKGFNELDQVAGNTVRGKRLRGAGAADGH